METRECIIDDYKEWLAKTPHLTTYRINTLTHNASDVFKILQSYLEEQMRTHRRQKLPDVYEIFPEVMGISIWPTRYENYFNEHRPEVIVDASCGAAVLRGAHIFAPGVVGYSTDIPLNKEVNVYCDTLNKCKRGLKIKFINDGKMYIGVGVLKQPRHKIFGNNARPKGVAVEMIMPVSRVPVIDNQIFPRGSCLLQNLPSIICSKVLSPRPGESILDMCAAPGNKTTHIAELMNNEGIVIALDRSITKVKQIQDKCSDHSITCVHSFVCDSTKAVREDKSDKVTNLLDGPAYSPESFDRVLLDAPCSALGQRPMLNFQTNDKILKSFAPLQRKLFHNAVKLLKRSGRLVYSTCTITKDECENMVAWALKSYPELELIVPCPLLGGPGCQNTNLNDVQRSMVQRFGPESNEMRFIDPIYKETIGFFIAAFVKK